MLPGFWRLCRVCLPSTTVDWRKLDVSKTRMSPFQVWVVFKFSTEQWWVLDPMIFMLKPTLKILKYGQHNIFLISKSWSYRESIVCPEYLIGTTPTWFQWLFSDSESAPQVTRFAYFFFPQVFFEGASLVLPFNYCFPIFYSQRKSHPIRGQPPGPPNRFCKSWHRFGAAGLTASVVCASMEVAMKKLGSL